MLSPGKKGIKLITVVIQHILLFRGIPVDTLVWILVVVIYLHTRNKLEIKTI